MSRVSMTKAAAFAVGCAGLVPVETALSSADYLPPVLRVLFMTLTGVTAAVGVAAQEQRSSKKTYYNGTVYPVNYNGTFYPIKGTVTAYWIGIAGLPKYLVSTCL